MAETLKEKTAKGLFWGGMNNFVQQVVGLVFGIILGRLLSPSDYGMIAMITIFSQIANAIQNSGFGAALTNLDHPTDEDYNSVFWFNVTASTTMYVILFFCAPFIADFYHMPALVPLSRYVFLSFVFSSFATAPYAYLFKNFQAKLQTKSGIIAVVTSSVVGAVLAFLDLGYWALATQSLVFVAVSSAMAWHYSAWHPTLHIDYRPAMRMFKFSCKILATTIVTQINNNVLNILLGHYFSAHDTGNYNQAYQWDSKCFNLVQGMVNQVAQPVLVDLRRNQGRQVQALRKLMRFTSFIAFPLLLGFGLVAREFIVLTITAHQWSHLSVGVFAFQSCHQRRAVGALFLDYGFTGRCGDRFDAAALSLWHSHDGRRLCLGQHRMVVCLAFLCQPSSGLFLVAVSQGHVALCVGCLGRDGCHPHSHK